MTRPHTRPVIFAASMLAGATAHADIDDLTLIVEADATTVSIGDTITWTVRTLNVIDDNYNYVRTYDLSLLANDESLGTATPFATGLSWLVGPTGGTSSGASLLGASGGQSALLDPVGLTYADVVLGTFQVLATDAGSLTYTIEDGGVFSTDILRIGQTQSFGGNIYFEGLPPNLQIDTVTILPAPTPIATIALAGLTLTRRRR